MVMNNGQPKPQRKPERSKAKRKGDTSRFVATEDSIRFVEPEGRGGDDKIAKAFAYGIRGKVFSSDDESERLINRIGRTIAKSIGPKAAVALEAKAKKSGKGNLAKWMTGEGYDPTDKASTEEFAEIYGAG